MKHIAAPFYAASGKRQHKTVILSGSLVLRAILYSLTCRPARVLCFRMPSFSLRHLIRAIYPKLRLIAEGAACALWLLFLIFGLNFFAALV